MNNQIIKKRSNKAEVSNVIAGLIYDYGKDLLIKTLEDKELLATSSHSLSTNSGLNKDSPLEKAISTFLNSGFFKYHLAESTRASYQSEINTFRQFAKGCEKIADILDPLIIGEYLSQFENVYTRNKKAAFLRSFFKEVIPELATNDPSFFKKYLAIAKSREHIPKAFTTKQINEMLCLTRLDTNLRNYTILQTFLGSGIRLSELIELKVKDIDFKNQTLWVVPKRYSTKFPRKINKRVLDELKEYIGFTYGHITEKENKEECFLFSTTSGKKAMTKRNVQYMVKDLVQRCSSIPLDKKNTFSCHNLRHTFAIQALEAGIDVYTISKLLGHESIASTQIYLELYDHQLKVAIEKHPFAKKWME
jgi:integrase/recombinase XerD